jgi:cytochrome c-type biogenesis protein CcmF
MISCFWEGQEGSFLLWAFWQMMLGFFVLKLPVQWKAPVMAVLCCSQALIISMLLGVYFWDFKLGSTPFMLLRDVMADAPVFQKSNYLDFVKDGKGLNPLLQNYWMVIHPPVLFLGFASTIIPFGFAIAGLWTKNYGEWVKPAFPWVLFSVGILGTGILMGGIWAYEALTFGGFWAWDPVENASLIPWIIMVACLHTMLVYNSTRHALFTTFTLALSSFLLVLYAFCG